MARTKRNESIYNFGTSAVELGRETISVQNHDQKPRFVLIEGGLSASACGSKTDSETHMPRRHERPAQSSYDEANRLMLRCLSPVQWGVVFLVTILMMVACLAISYNLEARAASRLEMALNSADTIEVTVVPGDTLWGIASQHSVDGIDTSDVVRWIEEVNHIEGGVIHVGQNLTVPTS